MTRRELGSAAAVACSELRPLTDDELRLHEGDLRRLHLWHSRGGVGPPPRPRVHVVSDQAVDGPEHGIDQEGTWCGLPRPGVSLMRHTFRPEGPFACTDCAREVVRAAEERGLRLG